MENDNLLICKLSDEFGDFMVECVRRCVYRVSNVAAYMVWPGVMSAYALMLEDKAIN